MTRVLLRAYRSPFHRVTPEQVLDRNLVGNNAGNLVFGQAVHRLLSTTDQDVTTSRLTRLRTATVGERFDHVVIPLANAFRATFLPQLDQLTRFVATVIVVGLAVALRLALRIAADGEGRHRVVRGGPPQDGSGRPAVARATSSGDPRLDGPWRGRHRGTLPTIVGENTQRGRLRLRLAIVITLRGREIRHRAPIRTRMSNSWSLGRTIRRRAGARVPRCVSPPTTRTNLRMTPLQGHPQILGPQDPPQRGGVSAASTSRTCRWLVP